jgi:glycosyltransferase involved in cell wall biosynthesis
MTAYNGEDYIEESIRSILAQSFKNFELILYLDGCTDRSGEIAKNVLRHSDQEFHIIDSSKNLGCPTGRVKCIEVSRGKFLAIQDADDISLATRLEVGINFLENNPDIFCIGSKAIKINEKGVEIGTMEYPSEDMSGIMSSILDKCSNPIIDPTVMFKKKDYYEIGGYSLDKNKRYVQDFDLWLRAILYGKKFHNIQDYLTKYRIHSDSITRKKNNMMGQHMAIWRKFVFDYHRKCRRK